MWQVESYSVGLCRANLRACASWLRGTPPYMPAETPTERIQITFKERYTRVRFVGGPGPGVIGVPPPTIADNIAATVPLSRAVQRSKFALSGKLKIISNNVMAAKQYILKNGYQYTPII